ncbi:hypothetical protein Pint_10225 [Pistacia integerrima]|uniref:Uncharacterized protein n=1 Tax=Pistacia integerrima TaxID=434235 RepID=A0ACC0XEB5_9ROSI|nr:hypothetical protein Pint_10225 [Pistacia integerrima]
MLRYHMFILIFELLLHKGIVSIDWLIGLLIGSGVGEAMQFTGHKIPLIYNRNET